MSSPWDVVWHHGWHEVAVAMAGIHQLWSFDPVTPALDIRAGTTHEGLVDGDVEHAWFAQPSGLASDGETLWLADSETSSLRRIRNGVVHTEVGRGLFDFGHVDGSAREALFQHPLGVAVLADGSVAVADTYNGAVRRFDPVGRQVSTLATGLAEPSDVLADGDYVLVVESAAHRLSRVRLPEAAVRVQRAEHRTQRPATEVGPGELSLEVVFTPPRGQALDDRYGPATHLVVSASPPELLVDGEGAGPELHRRLLLAPEATHGVLHVSVRAASCDTGAAEFPACHIHQQDWGVPLHVTPAGERRLVLVLAGLDGRGEE
jgi:hypothetical protein